MPAIADDDTGRMSDIESNVSERSVRRKMITTMTSPRESSRWNQNRSNMVPDCQEKSTIFSEKIQKCENEIFGDMVVS